MLRAIWDVVKKAAWDFLRHDASRMGASLAFYSVLSIAPLLVLTLAVGKNFLDEQEVREQLISQMQQTVGRQGSEALADMLTSWKNDGGTRATILGLATLLFGASGVFGELQFAMNKIWDVKPPENESWWQLVKKRFLSFMLVLGTGFLLLVSLALSALIAGTGESSHRALAASGAASDNCRRPSACSPSSRRSSP
ncbi:MAG: YhjD/YihY/BrkB family envelope integrity protein [Pirellulales bacterium]